MPETIKSNGLLGLPHYRNSRISTSLMEPVYLNKFTVQITLPAGIDPEGANGQVTNLFLEEVSKVGGLDTNKMPATVQEQTYKYATRSFASGKPDRTTVDLTLDFNVNVSYDGSNGQPSNFLIRTIRKWTDLIYDPLTGREGIKKDYVAPQAVITMLDRKWTPFWQWTCYNIFPTKSIGDPGLDYAQDGIYKITGWTLRCDYWDEVQL